jgi:hypothetical protein
MKKPWAIAQGKLALLHMILLMKTQFIAHLCLAILMPSSKKNTLRKKK